MRREEVITGIQALAGALAPLRADGKRIVQCHGVFDLLHIGHIRYFQKAKALGDILVVTLTPDRFVNKGTHRPAFPEHLRAEAIASLDYVDYVAINEWPTAVETIAILKPDIFVKGGEFRDNPTPELRREMAALDEAGGELALIEDITSSSSHLINRYMSPYSDEVDTYLFTLGKTYDVDEITRYLEEASSLKVLVVGETILDEYHNCQTIGQSSKAPILALQDLAHERFLGGAAALANQMAVFCENVSLVSLLGTQNSEERWIRSRLRANVQPEFIYKENSPTVVRRGYRESYFALPLLEVYVMNEAPLAPCEDETLCTLLGDTLSNYDLVIAADYAYTLMTDRAIHLMSEKAPFLAANVQANAGTMVYHTISRFPRADYACLAEQELRVDCRNPDGELRPMIHSLRERLNARQLVVTRGKHGCICHHGDGEFCESPALATQVVDRAGAGNAFLGITALCAVQQAPAELLAFLGNLAAARAIATVGADKPVEPLPFSRHIKSLLK